MKKRLTPPRRTTETAPLLAGCAAQSRPAEPVAAPKVALADTAAGNQLFHGLGNCNDCHGDGGVGTPEGPELVSDTWKLGDGSFEWLWG